MTLDRSSLAQTAAVSLVTLVAVMLLAAVLAYWTWALFAPRPRPLVTPTIESRGDLGSAQSLFGVLQRDQNDVAPTGIAIKLLGVVAATHKRRGYAVVQLDSREILAVREGGDVAPGIRLAEIHTDHVILLRNGARESLAWPQKGPAAEAATARITK